MIPTVLLLRWARASESRSKWDGLFLLNTRWPVWGEEPARNAGQKVMLQRSGEHKQVHLHSVVTWCDSTLSKQKYNVIRQQADWKRTVYNLFNFWLKILLLKLNLMWHGNRRAVINMRTSKLLSSSIKLTEQSALLFKLEMENSRQYHNTTPVQNLRPYIISH